MADSKQDLGISLARVMAMLLIIATHIISEIPKIKPLAQASNSAVYTFLIISGYLFGQRRITKYASWMFKRMTRIMVPSLIFFFIVAAYYAVTSQLNLHQAGYHLLNLQGLLGALPGLGHYWFITTIMFCYLVTIIMDKIRYKAVSANVHTLLLVLLFVIVLWGVGALFIPMNIGNNIGYILIYSASYIIGARELSKGLVKELVVTMALAILAVLIRLLTKEYHDGTLLYNVVIVGITQATLGYSIFVFFRWLGYTFKRHLPKHLISHLDSLSFAMFIVHYPLIVGPFKLWGLFNNYLLDSVIVILASYLGALLLSFLSRLATTMIEKG